jgi:hypothetical protein
MAHRSVRSEVLIFSGMGIWLLLCPLGSVSTQRPLAHILVMFTAGRCVLRCLNGRWNSVFESWWL